MRKLQDGDVVHGALFGIKVCNHGDRKAQDKGSRWLKLLIEDDGNWNDQDVMFDSYWVADLISVLQKVQKGLPKIRR